MGTTKLVTSMKSPTMRRAIGGAAVTAAVLITGVTASEGIEQFRSAYKDSPSTVSPVHDENTQTSAWLGPMGFWFRCYIPNCGMPRVYRA